MHLLYTDLSPPFISTPFFLFYHLRPREAADNSFQIQSAEKHYIMRAHTKDYMDICLGHASKWLLCPSSNQAANSWAEKLDQLPKWTLETGSKNELVPIRPILNAQLYCKNQSVYQLQDPLIYLSAYYNLTIYHFLTREQGLLGVYVLHHEVARCPETFVSDTGPGTFYTWHEPSTQTAMRFKHTPWNWHTPITSVSQQDDTCCCAARTDQIRGKRQGAQGVWSEVWSAVGMRGVTLKQLETTGGRALGVSSMLGLVYLFDTVDRLYVPYVPYLEPVQRD